MSVTPVHGGGGYNSVVEVTLPDMSTRQMPLHSNSKPREPVNVALFPDGPVLVRAFEQVNWSISYAMLGVLLVVLGLTGVSAVIALYAVGAVIVMEVVRHRARKRGLIAR